MTNDANDANDALTPLDALADKWLSEAAAHDRLAGQVHRPGDGSRHVTKADALREAAARPRTTLADVRGHAESRDEYGMAQGDRWQDDDAPFVDCTLPEARSLAAFGERDRTPEMCEPRTIIVRKETVIRTPWEKFEGHPPLTLRPR